MLFTDKLHSISFPSSACEFMNEEVGTNVKCRVDIYIGSDNDSRKINDLYLEKVRQWANEIFPHGYTIVRGEGYYNGVSEDSILLYTFLDYDPAIKRQLENLKRKLRQDAILFVKSEVDYEVV